MYYVYLLRSKFYGRYYVGQTSNLQKRFEEHNQGMDRFTKKYLPWRLIYYEAYQSRTLAIKRENQLKRFAKAFTELKKRVGE